MKLGEKRQCVRMKSVEILSESHRNKLRAHALAGAANHPGGRGGLRWAQVGALGALRYVRDCG